jgi:hypothetical protein
VINGQGDNRPYIQIIERRKDIILMAKVVCKKSIFYTKGHISFVK